MKNDVEKIVQLAISEDIGDGDLTSSLLGDKMIDAEIVCRENAVICGVEFANLCFLSIDRNIQIDWSVADGSEVNSGEVICRISGPAKNIVTAERVALNFLQLLSATSTKTAELVRLIRGTKAKLLDTRKTIPGLRRAQKYAVKCGGGVNHRMGLYDCVMLKENHILAIGSLEASIKNAVNKFPKIPIIVEVESLHELQSALSMRDINRVLCDNFSIEDLREAVKISSGIYPLEASGGMNENNILQYAETGVDFISIGSLTKDIKSIDLSLRFLN
ncbi:MAG: carboxylating nicotinate-nucleotide diphosphorylase [Candidatus Pseudothioglobus sp.]|jgi:nicotinate-nucleotide pyrophosphorylase (carboxylating)|tara:strand:+ start:50 stop:874 length:825 start_codon:yes stop_codon:yes gene_type:complete